jgi:pyridoxal phosphate enzyme (YggS family)
VVDRELKDRAEAIRQRVAEAARAAGRDPGAVRILAVTKGHDRRRVLDLIGLGFTLFGENRVQEAARKYVDMPPGISLHLIGHLQTNKVKSALGIFQVIQSLDSPRLAEALDRRSTGTVPVMVEVNAGREPQKHGLWPEDVPAFVESIRQWPHLTVVGLMVMVPAEGSPVRPMAEAADLWRSLRRKAWPWAPLDDLSMGMSADFEEAIRQGSTMVRIGTALVGPRAEGPAPAEEAPGRRHPKGEDG